MKFNDELLQQFFVLIFLSLKEQKQIRSHVKLSRIIITLCAFFFTTIIFTLWMEDVTVSLHRRNAQSKDDFWKHFSLGFFLPPSFYVFAEYTLTHTHPHTHTHTEALTFMAPFTHTLKRTHTMPLLTIQPATLLPETKHYFPLFIL